MRNIFLTISLIFFISSNFLHAMDEDQLILEKPSILRALKSTTKTLSSGRRKYKIIKSDMSGALQGHFLEDYGYLQGDVQFKRSPQGKSFVYKKTNSQFKSTEDAENQINGYVYLELEEIQNE